MFNQHCKDDTIYSEQGKDFILYIPFDVIHKDRLTEWVQQQQFRQYENQIYKIERATSNRVAVYTLMLPWNNQQVIMKVSRIHPLYNRRRKIELLIRNIIKKDYNLSAFEACLALRQNKIPVANPLAFWSIGQGLQKKSYFLYQKIDKPSSVKQFIHQLDVNSHDYAQQYRVVLLRKLINIAHAIHKSGWRHGDLAPRNFLLSPPATTGQSGVDKIMNCDIYLIDYDYCHRAKIKFALIKKFYDLKCLRGLRKLNLPYRDILTTYQNGRYSHFWYLVLLFWIHGGFNISRWFNRHLTRTQDSHLIKPD